MKRILLIEDEPEMVLCLKDNLEQEGYSVESASDGKNGLEKALRGGHDVILLDIMLPKMDGFAVCREIRRSRPEVPIVVISAKGQEIDKVLGLELGADDYVTKPFGVREILARIRAVLRRSARPLRRIEKAAFGEIQVDFLRLEVVRRGKRTRMSNYEARILEHLLSRKGEVVSRAELLREIWGSDRFAGDRTVDNYVAKLRRKVEGKPREPRFIITVHGVGYRFAP